MTAQIGDGEARIVADYLEARRPAVLEPTVAFDDPAWRRYSVTFG